MPSEKQLRWSQLRVGITVIVASVILAILIFLMSGTAGLFTKKITLKAYFNNATGLREGAPVRLEGVDIGNITGITIVSDKPLTPVQVSMKVSTKYDAVLRKDSMVTLTTAGVLGETFVDINSRSAKGPKAADGDTLATLERPDFQDMLKAGQSTLQNMQALIGRLDRIVGEVESGRGSVGKLLKDPALFDKMNATLGEMQKIVSNVSAGKGSIGKLLNDETLYNKLNASVDKVNKIVDEVNSGKGSAGKFLKDDQLYNNANQTLAKANRMMDDINQGKGAIGMLTKDQAFAAKLDNTMDKVSLIANRMEAGEGSAGKLLKDPSLYTNADQMLVETRNLVKAIRENPKKYLTIHFRIF